MSTPVEQIKERLDIVETISSYIKLDKAGLNYKGRCPFHNEKTPSFMVSPERQTFYCFGCQAKGDIFSFVEKFEGLDFRGALKLLAERAGVELREVNKQEEEKRDVLLRIMEKATIFFENNLKGGIAALEYIKSRGIKEEGIKKWRIGFALESWRDAHDFLLKEGFTKEDLLDAGMIKKVPNEEKYYDTFRNRIMFPIWDSSGRVIAFSGRSLSNDEKSPKYLNSPETDIFKKSEVLYGLNFAKAIIRSSDYSVLVEGQMDLVLSHEAGIVNTVASSGTALTSTHLARLKKISNRLIIAYDGDEAGQKAARRSLELALSLGMEVKIAKLPEGEDPASVAEKNPTEWKNILRDAKDGIMYCLERSIKGGSTGINLAKKISTKVLPLLSLVQNEMVKSQYVTLISKQTGISEQAIALEAAKQKTAPILETSIDAIALNPLTTTRLSLEEMLAGFILFKNDQVLKERFEGLFGKTFFEEVTENGAIDKESLIFEAERIFGSGEGEKMVEELFIRMESKVLKRRFEELASKLDEEKDEGERKKLEKEMSELSKKLSQLSN